MKRCKTNIKGFDELIQGGFPEKSVNLIAGGPGTGKTIFGLQYIINGVQKSKEPGLYVTFEQNKKDLIEQSKQFGWDIQKLEKSGKLKLLTVRGVSEEDPEPVTLIMQELKKKKYSRIVFDSLTDLTENAIYVKKVVDHTNITALDIRSYVKMLILDIKLLGVTSLFLVEKNKDATHLASEYASDGVVEFEFNPEMGSERCITVIVKKMRKTKIVRGERYLIFGKNGIEIITD